MQCCNEASKIFVRRSIFVFIFSSFSDAKESLKLRRFYAEDCEDFLGKFTNILDKNCLKKSKICNFLNTLNFNFPHIMLSSTAGKICSSYCLEENFNNRNFSFSFENLRIFEDLRRICNLRRSSKNF